LLRLDQPRAEGSLKQLLDKSIRAAELDEHEQELVGNVFAFKETTAGEVMVPRPDVDWLSVDQPLEQLLAKVSESGHTRFPLCDGGVDNVIGYLHAKDLAPLFRLAPGQAADLRSLARPVAFVPEAGRAISALRRLQRERSHLAIVVDEFGGMAGIVTLEDLLEELVGDIQDEFDEPTLAIQALDNGEWIVDGAVRLDDLEELGLRFGTAQEGTVGGYIFGRLAREVAPGDEVLIAGAALRVEAVEGLRVTRVRVISAPPATEELEELGEPEVAKLQQRLQPEPN
jgi:CBS domain containing-hemolysin-like protein